MSARRDTKFRVAVGSAGGPQSAIYVLWTHGDEVYVGIRSVAHEYKLSLHSTGDWRFAWTMPAAVRHFGDRAREQRIIERWSPPAPFAPGWFRPFYAVVPASELRSPLTPPSPRTSVHWLPPPESDVASYVTLLIADGCLPDAMPRADGYETETLHRHCLPGGRMIVVTAHQQVMTDAHRAHVDGLHAFAAQAVADRETTDDLRGTGWGHAEDGTRFFIDIAGPFRSQ